MSDDRLAVTLTVAELDARIRDAVIGALAEFRAGEPAQPDLVSGPEMARRIGVSRTTLHRLRLDGCPAIRVSDTYRYRPEDVLAWLETRR